MQHPEKVMEEAYRVLRSGGRYAFTVWCTPEQVDNIKNSVDMAPQYFSGSVGSDLQERRSGPNDLGATNNRAP
jgi:hypothetical protein